MMRQVNFVLWIACVITCNWVGGSPWHAPTGREWIPLAGLVVALFWPRSPKIAIVRRAAV